MEGRSSLIKPLREDQMDMLMMMEQMDKLPDFPSGSPVAFSDVSDLSSGSGYSSAASPHGIYDSTPLNIMSGHPPTLPFMAGNPNTEPHMPIFSDTAARVAGVSGSSLSSSSSLSVEQKRSSVAAMREMIFRIAAMQPIHIDPESVKPPKRRNVKISTDPQSVAARHRRERISERIRILQKLVPGGTKMDTASMLDEAIHYVKFLKTQVQSLERAATHCPNPTVAAGSISGGAYLSVGRSYQPAAGQMFAPPTQLLS